MIPFYVPNLPDSAELLPWLKKIDSNRFYTNNGPLLKQLQTELNDYLSQRFEQSISTALVGSGTAAIELTLRNLKLPSHSKILMPSYTFIATALAVINAGHVPVYADVDANSWSLTAEIATSCLNDDIAAVLTVAPFGLQQQSHSWQQFSLQHNIPVIIDAAAGFAEQPPANAVYVCHSLHATKSFGIGEGGLVISNDVTFCQRIQKMANFCLQDGEAFDLSGNFKLSEYHAAVGLTQLRRLEKLREKTQQLYAAYQELIDTSDALETNPNFFDSFSNVLALRVRDKKKRQAIKSALEKNSIQTRKMYTPTLHQHGPFTRFYQQQPLPVTEQLSTEIINLPFHHFLSAEQFNLISSCCV